MANQLQMGCIEAMLIEAVVAEGMEMGG